MDSSPICKQRQMDGLCCGGEREEMAPADDLTPASASDRPTGMDALQQLARTLVDAVGGEADDDDSELKRMLSVHGFADLSAREKSCVLLMELPVVKAEESSSKYPVFSVALKVDRVKCLRTLLALLTPHCGGGVAGDVASVLSGRMEESQDNLHCTTLAAELFAIGCRWNAMDCMMFLLEQVPDLMNVEIEDRTALDTAILEGSTITDVLLERKAQLGCVDICEALHKLYYPLSEHRRDLKRATQILSRNYEEEVRSYRSDNTNSSGYNLLHILLQNFNTFHRDWENILACVQTLMDIGFDSTDGILVEHSAFDMLLSQCMDLGGPLRDMSIAQYSKDFNPYMDAVVECARMLMPTFKVPNGLHRVFLRDLYALNSRVGNTHVRRKWIELYQLVLDNDVVPIKYFQSPRLCFDLPSHPTPWHQFIEGAEVVVRQGPCPTCKPLVTLLYTAIEKGLDVDRIQVARRSHMFPRRPDDAVQDGLRYDLSNIYIPDCCYLSLQELLMHCGADVSEVLQMGFLFPKLITMIVDPKHMSDLQRDAKSTTYPPGFLVRYFKSAMMHFPELIKHVLSEERDVNAWHKDCKKRKNLVRELQVVAWRLMSLKFIARRCILKQLRNKTRIDELDMPKALQRYVRTGEYVLQR